MERPRSINFQKEFPFAHLSRPSLTETVSYPSAGVTSAPYKHCYLCSLHLNLTFAKRSFWKPAKSNDAHGGVHADYRLRQLIFALYVRGNAIIELWTSPVIPYQNTKISPDQKTWDTSDRSMLVPNCGYLLSSSAPEPFVIWKTYMKRGLFL
jgi:hypothetical protein